MKTNLGCVLLLAALSARAEIIDRIAVTVGNRVITESDILREIRLTAFVNGDPVDTGAAARRQTAGRLVEQILIRREMELSSYPMPAPAEADPLLKQVKDQRFPGGKGYREDLRKYGIKEEDLREYLLRQAATLRFIDLRFRPGAQVSEQELTEYYEKRFVPEWQNKSKQLPPLLDEVRGRIEETVFAERVDGLLDAWLKETRGHTRIVYQEDVFR